MSLDVCMLGEDGSPGCTIAIGLSTHQALMEAARRGDADLLLRLADYYDDAEFAPDELAQLKHQVASCATHATDGGLLKVLADVEALIAEAQARALPVMVIAD